MDLQKLAGIKINPKDIEYELEKIKAGFDFAKQYFEQYEKDGKMLKKCTELSCKFRMAGNDLYKKNGHDSTIHKEILSNYSKSIAVAPKDSEELVLGYSNRSVILMHLHRYHEALVDIETTLELTTSNELKEKVQARKKKCLELIEEENLARLAKNVNLCDNGSQENSAPKLTNPKLSTALPCASESVGLAYNKRFGRHLIATRDIEPGEILIVEDGQVCCPAPLFIYCSHCLKMAWNGIPCDDCVLTMYCSETCKNEALNEYHDIECSMLKYMQATVFNFEEHGWERMITIRLLIKAMKGEGFENVMKEIIQAGTGENLVNILSDGVLQSNKFKTYYNLLPHPEQYEKLQEVYEFNTFLMLYVLIEHTNFLSIGTPPGLKITMEPYLLIKLKEALLKLRYITNTTSYAFATNSWYCGCTKSCGECNLFCQLLRGIVMVPCCSLINHSCTPNVGHSVAPNLKVIIFSTRPVKKGEQLFDHYNGISLAESDFNVRAELLRFTCKCNACVDKIEYSTLLHSSKNDYRSIRSKITKFPKAMQNLFFLDSFEGCKMSEEILQYVIKMSQFFYKNFDYYKAYVHSLKCMQYIAKFMITSHEEKSPIPNDC